MKNIIKSYLIKYQNLSKIFYLYTRVLKPRVTSNTLRLLVNTVHDGDWYKLAANRKLAFDISSNSLCDSHQHRQSTNI